MKKRNIAEIVLVIIFAGFVFFLGWTQFKVGSDKCGILVSKTGGVNSEPVLPGKFSWHWEFLIPTNAELRLFGLTPYTETKTVQGTLPSADVYSAVYESHPDFSYSFDFSISGKVAPADIAELVKNGDISDSDGLKSYLDSAYTSLANKAAVFILDKAAAAGSSFRPESLKPDDILNGIETARAWPYIVFTDFSITSSKLPDRTLYNSARDTYIEEQKRLQERAVERKKKVSELLQQFPELQDLFPGNN
ncbi:MAG TPA: hypothetical protein DCL73_06605 [Treponema sp.]|nr:hypothetical protein [Treponema sp.]